jgi:UTP:GlnB (protein PII) uridylyltransferase
MLSRMMARLRPQGSRRLRDSDDFIVDYNRINLAVPDVFEHDPVNLIRIFRLAQKHNLAFHPDAMRSAKLSLGLITQQLRDDEEANKLFVEILTSDNAADERSRRARPLHSAVRQDRLDDAVQHVSSLHGRRAPVALHRQPAGDRARQ